MGILEEHRYQPRLDRGSRGLRRSVRVRVSGSGSVSGQRNAACMGDWRVRVRRAARVPLFSFPRTAHELAHPHALAHATREPRAGPSGAPPKRRRAPHAINGSLRRRDRRKAISSSKTAKAGHRKRG